jgi:Ca2+/Na+ antiporter
MYVCMYVCMYVYIYNSIYIYLLCVCVCVCVCIHIYIHTYTNTHTQTNTHTHTHTYTHLVNVCDGTAAATALLDACVNHDIKRDCLLRCQYLHFCTSKASKLRTCIRSNRVHLHQLQHTLTVMPALSGPATRGRPRSPCTCAGASVHSVGSTACSCGCCTEGGRRRRSQQSITWDSTHEAWQARERQYLYFCTMSYS